MSKLRSVASSAAALTTFGRFPHLLGGIAVANYDSVEDGEKVVATALDNFGRVDIVINNAGILRDRSFARTSDSDWDLVHKVHLGGAFRVTRAAWPHMKKNGYGRVVLTSSLNGLMGTFGQANYSSAKMGLVGLAKVLAVEGEASGIQCNVIVPMAISRLTQDLIPPDLADLMRPSLVAPVVAWLCHEECQDNGSVIEAAGGWAGKYRLQRSRGNFLLDPPEEGKDVPISIPLERVRDRWEQVVSMEAGADFPESNHEAMADMVSRINDGLEAGKGQSTPSTRGSSSGTGPLSAVGFTSEPTEFSYTVRDVCLYALGVGASTADEHGLRLVYEGHDDFSVLPTFGVLPALNACFEQVQEGLPGINIDLSMLLHGEQYVEVLCPVGEGIPTSANLRTTSTVEAVLDKGKGCLVVISTLSEDVDTGKPLFKNQTSLYLRGEGGFGGPTSSEKVIEPARIPTDRAPDAISEHQTTCDQAALYRLSGDLNPLHIDPNFSVLGGFSSPILHGLCSYGICARHVVEKFAGGDPNAVKAVKARFARPVYPGQTLVTKMWRSPSTPGRILFVGEVKETGEECLSGGWVDFKSGSSKL